MNGENILNKMLSETNELFGKVLAYNSRLLTLCNANDYDPNQNDIFDFYITSHAMTFLKNFYYNYIESPGIFLNARCIIEGLALKIAFRNDYLDEFNLELLKHQDALIEYQQYKKFNEIMESVIIPKDLKAKYDEAVEFYKNTLVSFDKKELKKVINSQIPFLGDAKITYRQIIKDNLGDEVAHYYSMLSSIIHPTSNESLTSEMHTFILLDTFHLLKEEFKDLPSGNGDLKMFSNFIFMSKEAEQFNYLIKAECTQLEKIQEDFVKNFSKNYVSDTFHTISMTIQEMMFDTVFGFTEQVKSKWKVMIELIAGFYEVYLNSDDVENTYRMVQIHEDVSLARSVDSKEAEENLKKAYEYYKKKYPKGVSYELFSHKFISTVGFTIDEEGKVKTLTQLVNQLCNLFDERVGGFKTSDILKINYVESQMLSHANGYLWFANSGAWGDITNVFMNFNSVMSFICFYMSNIYKDVYTQTKQYKDKKTSNILKQTGIFIRDNTKTIYENMLKRQGILPGTPGKYNGIIH